MSDAGMERMRYCEYNLGVHHFSTTKVPPSSSITRKRETMIEAWHYRDRFGCSAPGQSGGKWCSGLLPRAQASPSEPGCPSGVYSPSHSRSAPATTAAMLRRTTTPPPLSSSTRPPLYRTSSFPRAKLSASSPSAARSCSPSRPHRLRPLLLPPPHLRPRPLPLPGGSWW